MISFPPDVNALAALRSVILGAGAATVNRSVAEVADVPAVVVTVTLKVMPQDAASTAGVKTVIDVGEFTVKLAAGRDT